MNLLNLGCGKRFHPAWINVDFVVTGPGVREHDLRTGIPFGAGTFDVVYHSHVLEHFSQEQGRLFLGECLRVLRPGGLIRVAVPDLERIATGYLQALANAMAGAHADYDWMMLELYDQTVRERPGGKMQEYLAQNPLPNEPFIRARIGKEMDQIVVHAQRPAPIRSAVRPHGLMRKIRHYIRRPDQIREMVLRRILRDEYRLLELGRFRRRGEVHLWMYDRYSLRRELTAAGFIAPQSQSATTSACAGWHEFQLDTDATGVVYKPDSLFMEARKPN
ncbi:MAG: hypothetical protein PCFJNLEI_01854 [Verrucomicrobiae bacterium]|nr:hypothetical protein [Verrucomicrobiae bacterium]